MNSDPGVRVFVREVVQKGGDHAKPVLLVHGARVPGLASFDLPVAGGSLAADLAERGFAVYVMDVRGYGASTRPAEMSLPPENKPVLVRSNEAARDISAVVDWIRRRRHTERITLFGWAAGGQWAGHYSTWYPERIAALILLNSLYSGNSPQAVIGRGSDLDDPAKPGTFNSLACGAYRWNSERSLLGVWDRNIPVEDKSRWRDPEVTKAFVQAALASDPTSSARNPPSFRSPCGAMEDSFYLATGRQLWDASLIQAPTLILVSELDFWSRPEDRETLARHLAHASRVETVIIPGATHFVHLDRPEHGRNQMLDQVTSFIGR